MIRMQRYNAVAMLVAIPVATLFVVLRWRVAAHEKLGDFVAAGSRYASTTRVPSDLPVKTGSGYDGQFYYRLASDPFDLAANRLRDPIGLVLRVERMGYPFSLPGCGSGAARHRCHLLWSSSTSSPAASSHWRRPSDPVGRSPCPLGPRVRRLSGSLLDTRKRPHRAHRCCLLLLGLATMVRQAPILSGVALLCATVSKETSVLLVGTLALTAQYLRRSEPELESVLSPNGSFPGHPRRGHPRAGASGPGASGPGASGPGTSGRLSPRRSDLAFLIPIAGFIVWQLVLLTPPASCPSTRRGKSRYPIGRSRRPLALPVTLPDDGLRSVAGRAPGPHLRGRGRRPFFPRCPGRVPCSAGRLCTPGADSRDGNLVGRRRISKPGRRLPHELAAAAVSTGPHLAVGAGLCRHLGRRRRRARQVHPKTPGAPLGGAGSIAVQLCCYRLGR